MSESATGKKFACPKCESDHIQLFSMAFQSGTSTSTSTTTGMGFGSGGLGAFGAVSESSNVTLLAQTVAPPAKRATNLWGIMLILGTMMLAAGLQNIPVLIMGVLLIAVGFHFFRSAVKWNKEEYPRLLAQWESSWICHKCGNTFKLS